MRLGPHTGTVGKRILALDVGEARIGMAMSDPTGQIAQPLHTFERETVAADVARVLETARAYEVATIVVGLPLGPENELTPQAKKVRRFARALRRESQIPVALYDERLTTAEAQELLIAADVSRARRKRVIDSVAAAAILRGYLDSQG
jgi:putative Holliday junction resolvase